MRLASLQFQAISALMRMGFNYFVAPPPAAGPLRFGRFARRGRRHGSLCPGRSDSRAARYPRLFDQPRKWLVFEFSSLPKSFPTRRAQEARFRKFDSTLNVVQEHDAGLLCGTPRQIRGWLHLGGLRVGLGFRGVLAGRKRRFRVGLR